jgi:hypothetical protein
MKNVRVLVVRTLLGGLTSQDIWFDEEQEAILPALPLDSFTLDSYISDLSGKPQGHSDSKFQEDQPASRSIEDVFTEDFSTDSNCINLEGWSPFWSGV